MGLIEANELTVGFGDVVAALRSLGGCAHSDVIGVRIAAERRVPLRERTSVQARVRQLLAEQEASAQALVERVFGSDSNRWRLS